MVKLLRLLLLVFLLQQGLYSQTIRVEDIAKKYSNVKEIGTNNKGFSDKDFQNALYKLGWRPTLQWCAFFLSLCLKESDAIYPTIRSGSSQKFILKESIPFKNVLNGTYKLTEPVIIVYTNGNSITGHVDIVLRQINSFTFEVIGGNVNDKVTKRIVKYNPNSAQRINCFTLIGY